MAVAFVNTANSGLVCDNTSIAIPAMSLTAGNAVFVLATSDTDITGVTDSAGNTYTKLLDWTGAIAWPFSDIWVARVATGGASVTITVTRATPAAGPCAIAQAYQYSGLGDIAPALVASANATQAAGTSVTSGSFSPSGAALNIAQLLLSNNTKTYTAGTNYTLRGPGSASYQSAEDRIAPPSGAQTASFSVDTATDLSIQVAAVQGRHDLPGGAGAYAYGLAGTPAVEAGDKALSGVVAYAYGVAGVPVAEKLLSGAVSYSYGAAGAVTQDASFSGVVSMTWMLQGQIESEGKKERWLISPSRGPWMHRVKPG